jgi:hypothetical protein
MVKRKMKEQTATHTPAPWIMEHDEEEGTVTVWAGSAIEDRHTGMYDTAGEMELYSTVYLDGDCNESYEECLANGRLIAAAPDLLEALRFVLETPGNEISKEGYAKAYAAIAKAA